MSKIDFFDTEIEGRTYFKTAHILDMSEIPEIFEFSRTYYRHTEGKNYTSV